MHIATLVGAILFYAAIPYSLNRQNDAEAIAQVILGSLLLIYTLILKVDHNKKKDFTVWLIQQREYGDIAGLGLAYDGATIDGNTTFVQYEVCFSFVVASIRKRTNYYIRGHHPTKLYNLLFTLFTLVFGWWGIPWGPIYTIRALGFNLSRRTLKLEDVLLEVEAGLRD